MTSLEAVILAGGRGTRLQSLVSDRPKPMAVVNGRPFIEWLVRQLVAQGICHIIVSTGYLAETFERHLGTGKRFGAEVVYSWEENALGTGGATRLALSHVHGDRLLVLNGDSYCRFDLPTMVQLHERVSASATLWLTNVDDCDRYGTVQTAEDGSVVAFREKQLGSGVGTISAGIYLLQRSTVEAIPANRPVSIEREVFPVLIGRGLFATIGHGPFLDIGTPESYTAADAVLGNELARFSTAPTDTAMIARAQQHLRESAMIFNELADNAGEKILEAVHLLRSSFEQGGKLLLCGNGGSAADAQHLAAEFVSRLTQECERPALPAVALTTDTSFLTAYANDLHFDGIFVRQIEALGHPGDVLVCFSTSGNSRNIVLAAEEARRSGLKTLAFVGNRGRLSELADCALVVPSRNTQYIQEATVALYHIVCDLVERALYG